MKPSRVQVLLTASLLRDYEAIFIAVISIGRWERRTRQRGQGSVGLVHRESQNRARCFSADPTPRRVADRIHELSGRIGANDVAAIRGWVPLGRREDVARPASRDGHSRCRTAPNVLYLTRGVSQVSTDGSDRSPKPLPRGKIRTQGQLTCGISLTHTGCSLSGQPSNCETERDRR
jgi:hypothetical protein